MGFDLTEYVCVLKLIIVYLDWNLLFQFLYMDSSETISPRRTVETFQSMTPGGTLVTTTTTTTQRPQNSRYDTSIDGTSWVEVY